MPTRLVECYRRLPAPVRDVLRWPRQPLRSLVRKVIDVRTGERVAAGPFRGMAWPLAETSRTFHLGLYERELHPAIEDLSATPFELMVDLGAGDGYYAVGLARRWPEATIIAFEMDPRRRDHIRRAAAANDVAARVEVRGLATPEELAPLLAGSAAGKTFILADVEGAEVELLDPEVTPALTAVTILVEVHELFRPGCQQLLEERFAATHAVSVIEPELRRLEEARPTLPEALLRWLPGTVARIISDERLEKINWLLMIPR